MLTDKRKTPLFSGVFRIPDVKTGFTTISHSQGMGGDKLSIGEELGGSQI
jgi:hypothetical protein